MHHCRAEKVSLKFRLSQTAAMLAVALLFTGFAPIARADGLFGGEEAKGPQPWFGSTVDSAYESARETVLVPVGDATARILSDPTVQSWIDRAQTAARSLADAALGFVAAQPGDATPRPSLTALQGPLANEMQMAAPATLRPKAVEPPVVTGPDPIDDMAGADPFEPLNRMMFSLNNGLRAALFDPVVNVYHRNTTAAVQANVHNFFANLREPVTIVSNLAEGRFAGAGNATARFGINTVIGVAGLRDPATGMGFPSQPRNLEQTLCSYRLPAGPYVVLPFFGPATARDAVARIATNVAYYQAMGTGIYISYRVTDVTLQYSEIRERVRVIDGISLDPYLAQRRAYLTTRKLECGLQAIANQELFAK